MPPIRLYRLTAASAVELTLPGMTSLDAVTCQLPPGFYSTFRTFDRRTRVLGLRQHLDRLYTPAAALGLQPRASREQLRRLLAGLLASDPHTGPAEVRLRLVLDRSGQLFALLEPLVPLPPEIYRDGVHVISLDLHRDQPRLKTTAFIESSQPQRRRLAETGAFEALLLHHGRLLEGITSSFFYILDGNLGTARRGILLGVTRRAVLHLARRLDLPVLYRPLDLTRLPQVAEAFITSSSRGLVPVVRIDETPIGAGRPGPLTLQLTAAYARYLHRRAEPLLPA